MYNINPFVESDLIARYVAQRTTPDETIAVLGSEPQLYFYANRRGATRHVYTYGLVEAQPLNRLIQQELIRDVEQAKPRYIISVSVWPSWALEEKAPTLIYDWINTYPPAYYTLEAVVKITPNKSRLLLGKSAIAYQQTHLFLTKPDFYVPIWRRK